MSLITDVCGTEDLITDVSCCRRINWDDFGTSGDNVVLHSALLEIVKSSGQAVDFTRKLTLFLSNM